jgi:nucleoside-diphosphate-sugar epimerase
MVSSKKQKNIIVSGASGFVGKYFIDFIKKDFNVIAIARRSQNESGISYHSNIHWIQWDIANASFLNQVLGFIIAKGGADYFVHLAGYYNFDYKYHPEYERTNVKGTKNVLELAKKLNIKRFIFSSSLAACSFSDKNRIIDESTAPDAHFDYAVSKQKGEELVKLYSNYFSHSIIRFAAVFSDWCEYPPLYKFLCTWLKKGYDSRILAGKGFSGVSYIHIYDLARLMKTILVKHVDLPQQSTYVASPDGSTTHLELFKISTKDFFGKERKPIFLPKFLAYPGILVRIWLGKLKITPPSFEQLWMVKYIDHQLRVNAEKTRNELGWDTTPRYHILRRLLFLLVNMKSHKQEWESKNEASMHRWSMRPNLKIYEEMLQMQDLILAKVYQCIVIDDKKAEFKNFKLLPKAEFNEYVSQVYHLILASVRSGDKSLMLAYIGDIAVDRFADGFDINELSAFFLCINEIIVHEMLQISELQKLKQDIYDSIELSIQMAIDEMEDTYENLENKLTPEKLTQLKSLQDQEKRKVMIEKLSAFYQENE